MYMYRVHTKSSCDPDEAWLSRFRAHFTCVGCHRVARRLCETGADVYLTHAPDAAAINFVSGTCIDLGRREFLELFADEVQKYLKLGRVFTADAQTCERYATFITEKPLVLRGGAKSRYRTCEVCGCFCYMADLKWCVLRASLTGQPLYQCTRGGLVVNEELRGRIERVRWKGIYITKIPVVEKAEDGIDEFPENYC
jgi:hypothetical protein